MLHFALTRIALPLLVAAFSLSGAQAETERFSVFLHEEPVGELVADTRGDVTRVSFKWQSNGRGPDTEETIRYGGGLAPVAWQVGGASMMGGEVDETYEWKSGRSVWSSGAEEGDVKRNEPPLYITNDGSPWRLAVLARALLADEDQKADVLPAGSVSLEKVRDVTFGKDAKAVQTNVFRLTGTEISPDYVALEPDGKMFAYFSLRGIGIRSGYESEFDAVYELYRDLEKERVIAITEAVTRAYNAPIVIRNARIFDPASGKTGPLSTVEIDGDRIVRIAPAGAKDAGQKDEAVIIDAAGGTLLPGLYDMHSHAALDAGLFNLAAGVTSARDMGNYNDFMREYLPMAQSGDIASPRLTIAGILEGHSQYALNMGFQPDSIDAALDAVRWYAGRGYQMIKIYSSFNPDWVKPVAAEAHKLGLEVGGHVPAFTDADRMIRDGYDTLVHLNLVLFTWLIDPQTEDTRTLLRVTGLARAADLDLDSSDVTASIKLMKEHETAIDPTAVILERLMLSRAGVVHESSAAILDHMPVGFQRQRKRTYVTIGSEEEDLNYQKGFQKVLDLLGLLYREGVELLPGTDDATGFGLHRELEIYTMAGMPAPTVLRMATLDAARHLKQDADLGSLEKGKLADLVLYDGDPSKDIKAVRRPKMVMKGGKIFFPSEIYERLSITPFAGPPSIEIPEEITP